LQPASLINDFERLSAIPGQKIYSAFYMVFWISGERILKYDVIIVGAGPAGIFSALELADKTELSVLMLEKGPDIDKRKCPASRGLGCLNCSPCSLLSGWGGAGAFSDGKLTLSTQVGGWLNEYYAKEKLSDFVDYVDSIYRKYGAALDKMGDIGRRASFAGLKLIPQKVRHMGTEKCAETLRKMRRHLKDRVEIQTKTEVQSLLVHKTRVEGVETSGEKIYGKYVIVAPGRSGAEWLKVEAESLGLKTLNNPVDVGVRV
jgi:uncharacterized FAD-dependent dehydrogenase